MKENMAKPFVQFILGGVKSGKTDFAFECAAQKSKGGVYIAAAESLQEASGSWRVVKETLYLNECFLKCVDAGIVVVDSLTAFVLNAFRHKWTREQILAETDSLLESAASHDSGMTLIFISNEPSFFFPPEDRATRDFAETLGMVNQLVAKSSDEIYYMIAGVPTVVKKEFEMPASRFSLLAQGTAGMIGESAGDGYDVSGLDMFAAHDETFFKELRGDGDDEQGM